MSGAGVGWGNLDIKVGPFFPSLGVDIEVPFLNGTGVPLVLKVHFAGVQL
jgi:hypothetical protein